VLALNIAQGVTRRTAGRKAKGDGTAKAPRTVTATYTGPRRSIGGHVAAYFADKPVGHGAKFGTLAKFASAEYPDGASSGAIQAYFLRNNQAETPGIVLSEVDGVKGAVKQS
jgi:hypothetical protein